MRERWAWWVATAGGVGAVPWAPGTFGSAVGLIVAVTAGATVSLPGYVAVTVILFGIGVAAAERSERGAGRKDPSHVVIDEVVGMLVAALGLSDSPGELVAAFLLFRVFDIAKPPPLRRLEAQAGGWGIMLDDVAAGIYANLAVRLGSWALGAT